VQACAVGRLQNVNGNPEGVAKLARRGGEKSTRRTDRAKSDKKAACTDRVED